MPDQYIVQRKTLGAPNEQTARRGSIFAAFLQTLSRLADLFIIPGLICFALAKSGKMPGLGGVW